MLKINNPIDFINNKNQNKLLTNSNSANVPDYNNSLDQYTKEYERLKSERGETDAETYKAMNNLDRLKINNFLFKNGYDLNELNFDNLNFDNMGKVADNLVNEWNASKGTKGANPEQAYYEWLNMTNKPLMSRQFRGRSEGLREFGNNMNNIQKQVYDLRNQFQSPISPYNQQQISPDEYQKQRQQKWGELPLISSSVYDRATKPYASTDDYTAYLKRASTERCFI